MQTWDVNLANSAQRYARHLAVTAACSMHHSTAAFREAIPGWRGELAGEGGGRAGVMVEGRREIQART